MIDLLNDADLRYICSVVPLNHVIGYFTKNSKEFSKLQKGFRAKSLNESQKVRLLFNGAKTGNGFVCDFINKHITDWLEQIAVHIEQEVEKTKDEKQAVLNTLVDSFFVNNVALYYKLAGLNETEEYIAIAQAKVLSLKQSQIEAAETERRFTKLETEITRLQKLLDSATEEKDYLTSKNSLLNRELAEEKKKSSATTAEVIKMQKQQEDIESSTSKRIETLINDVKNAESNRQKLLAEIKALKTESDENVSKIAELEVALKEVYSLVKISASVSDVVHSVPKMPQDIDEFKEYLEYNLEAFGVKSGKSLLGSHLTNILFTGQPIAVERSIVQGLAKCIANTLTSGDEVKTLLYSPNVDIDIISAFLACDCRIVVLDNFLGNMNETLLLPLFDRYKDKIIFLGIAYEKALRYVADDFWIYAKHLNLLHTGFRDVPQIMEDASEFKECVNYATSTNVDSRTAKILVEIAGELRLSKNYAISRARDAKNEEALLGILCFELLPFTQYILGRNSLASERLQKYIRISKSTNIDLIKEWYSE